jgi:hypothetical protein
MMNNARRTLCQSLISAISLSGITACSQTAPRAPQRTYTEEQQRRMHKFRGVGGYETVISGFGSSFDTGVFIVLSNDRGQIFEEGLFWEKKDSKSTLGIYPPGLMKTLTATAYNKRGGQPLYEITIPVADRIPDDLLDDLRRNPKGTLRIKIRLHREGVLLGWDIERRPGFDPKKRDSFGEIAYVSPGWVKTGGDFKEARFLEWIESVDGTLIKAPDKRSINGELPRELAARGMRLRNGFLWEPGWYIHPKTGQRIETDF